MAQIQIDFHNSKPKYVQIINSITNAIRKNELKRNDKLLSINELSARYYLSRDTVQKAYDILEQKGIIIPVHGKGFFVNRTNVSSSYSVMLIFNKLSTYKKHIYDSFVKEIGPDATVDLKIHHSNVQIFENLIETYLNDYDYFLIMPHFYDSPELARRVLKKIPQTKLILLDKHIDDMDKVQASVYQDFKNDILNALESGRELLLRYKKMILVFPKLVHYPQEIVHGFMKFCVQNQFAYEIFSEITPATQVEKNTVYIVIEETDLVTLIKLARQTDCTIGKNLGLISYNDTPLKEILLDGITVLSTDHSEMGREAARLVL
ncbi:MAG: GntR family transcriptional regulator [Mucilaginibacter polytrichastri]|nr:GntR family transcriptional regulator [Mucilaginibacter polytrichastri]